MVEPREELKLRIPQSLKCSLVNEMSAEMRKTGKLTSLNAYVVKILEAQKK